MFAAAFAASVCRANSPFEIKVSATGPGDITIGSSDFLDLVDAFIKAEDHFNAYNGYQTHANLTYLAIENAMIFDITPAGTFAQLQIPSIGLNRNFNGTSRADVENQIEDFFQSEGADLYAQFLAAVAQQSPLAVTDGNPNAATATQAEETFASEGFTPVEDLFVEDISRSGGTDTSPRISGFGIGLNSGKFKAAGLSGSKTDLSIPFKFGINERLSLSGSVPFHYMTLEDAKIYGAGLNLALPYRIKIMSKDNPLNWRLSPTVGISARASKELASGAALVDYGLVNTLDYRLNSRFIICLVNQITNYQSLEVSYDGYDFDPDIQQTILKNGGRLVTKLAERWIGDFFLIDTRFLEDAAVDQFTTVGTSISYRLTRTRNLQLGFNYDKGDNFEAWSAGLSSSWKF